MASSANIGRVLWPKKAKTHEINEMATNNSSSGFEGKADIDRRRWTHLERSESRYKFRAGPGSLAMLVAIRRHLKSFTPSPKKSAAH